MYPVLENVSSSHKITIEAQVTDMIRKNDSIRTHMDDPRVVEKLREVMANPGIRFLLGRFKGYLNYTKDEVRRALPWWMDRIRETRPSLYKVFTGEPGGCDWFGNVLYETLTIFKEYYEEK